MHTHETKVQMKAHRCPPRVNSHVTQWSDPISVAANGMLSWTREILIGYFNGGLGHLTGYIKNRFIITVHSFCSFPPLWGRETKLVQSVSNPIDNERRGTRVLYAAPPTSFAVAWHRDLVFGKCVMFGLPAFIGTLFSTHDQ